jgi:hypothetical protein
LRDYLHRFWFEFGGPREALPPGGWIGCGVTAVDRSDAERLLLDDLFGGGGLPPIARLVEDVDVSQLDAGHVIPHMGDPTIRGVWFPRL